MQTASFVVNTDLLKNEERKEVTPELMAKTLRYIVDTTKTRLDLLESTSLIRNLNDAINHPVAPVDAGVMSQVVSVPNATFTALQYTFKPNSKVPIHCHLESAEYQIFSGDAEVFLNGDVVSVGRGTVVGVVPGDFHATRNNTGETLMRSVFYIPPQRPNDYYEAEAVMLKDW